MYKIYDIVLHTDIGDKLGKLQLFVNDEGKLNGKLFILGREQECIGTVDDNGQCELSGTLVTLKNKISYIATGYLRSSELLMTLRYKTQSYLLRGKRTEA